MSVFGNNKYIKRKEYTQLKREQRKRNKVVIVKERLVVKELCEIDEEGNCFIDIVKDMYVEDELVKEN